MRTDGSSPSGGIVRRRDAAAYAALALIAVHVADDNFFQPQPGTSASGHLVSGLVPLAVLALVAASYGRMREGLRAVVAICVGAFAIVAAAGEAMYYSLKLGPSGDDYTGLVAGAAGLVLVAIGITTAWQARRRQASRALRYTRRSLI